MAESLSDFYETFALVSFAVLGLWLVAAEFMGGRARSAADWRLGHAIALQFALLGAMSLLAQVEIERGMVWRFAFAGGAALAAVLVYGRAVRGRSDPTSLPGLTGWGMVALNVGVALVALVPNQVLEDAGTTLSALELEAILLSVLALLAINLGVWLIFEPRPAAGDDGGGGHDG